MQFYQVPRSAIWASAEGYVIDIRGGAFIVVSPLGIKVAATASQEEAVQAATADWETFRLKRMDGVPEFEGHPDPYAEGARAYTAQKDAHDCPYPEGHSRMLWMRGWVHMSCAAPHQPLLKDQH